jgi:hypothetical protein
MALLVKGWGVKRKQVESSKLKGKGKNKENCR